MVGIPQSDWTLVVPYMDGFALSLDQSESELLKTPKGSIVFHHNEDFIKRVSDNWTKWITRLQNQDGCKKIELSTEQYLSDVIAR